MAKSFLFHYGTYQSLWDQPDLIQCGPNISESSPGIFVGSANISCLNKAIFERGLSNRSVLIHYTDPFLLRAAGLSGMNEWCGPKLLVCGDLHHGPSPIETLIDYHAKEFHDAVLLTFNPLLLENVRKKLSVPTHSIPPAFFRYPFRRTNVSRSLHLLHVGSLGPHHVNRREIVETLLERSNIPFLHATTKNSDEAADLYNKSALVLNIPLNNDLNHRFFEIMAAGSCQIIFGNKILLGSHTELGQRPDIFWVQSIDELENLVSSLLRGNNVLDIQIKPPPVNKLDTLLKKAFSWDY